MLSEEVEAVPSAGHVSMADNTCDASFGYGSFCVHAPDEFQIGRLLFCPMYFVSLLQHLEKV